MFRIVKWEFPIASPAYMFSTELVIGNRIMLSKLHRKDPEFTLWGLGLSRIEREIRECKRFQIDDVIHLYLGKFLISWNRKGYKHHMKAVRITTDKVLI